MNNLVGCPRDHGAKPQVVIKIGRAGDVKPFDKIAVGTNPVIKKKPFFKRAFGIIEAGAWKVLKRGQTEARLEI